MANGDRPQGATPAPGATPSPSRVVITFGGPGEADHSIQPEGVTFGQLCAAAWMLDTYVRELRAQGQVAQRGLVVPAPGGLTPPGRH